MSFEQSRMVLGFHNENFRGPGIVAKNLISGLNRLNYPWINAATGVTNNQEIFEKPDVYTVFGVLQALALPQNIKIDLLGPNTFVMPREAQGLIAQSKALVVPSQWCKDKYLFYDKDIIGNRPIYVWPVGVDTEFFKQNAEKTKPQKISDMKVLVYYKNRPEEVLQEAITLLSNFGIKLENIIILRYGSFSRNDLIAACNTSHFAVLVAHTESQGLANLEILSMGLPMLVFDQKEWIYLDDKSIVWNEATSVPYFDETCGKKVANFIGENYGEFFDKVLDGSYKPREYVVNNFGLEQRAEEYLRIIIESNKLH